METNSPLNISDSVDLLVKCLPMTKHLFISSSYVHFIILSDLKCHESPTSSSRSHLWSAKEKEWIKNNNKKNKFFNLQNTVYFLFLLFRALLLSNLITFLFIIHFKNYLKDYNKSTTWSSTNHHWIIITIYKEFFECSGISLCSVW